MWETLQNQITYQETTGRTFLMVFAQQKNCLASSSSNHPVLSLNFEKALQGKPAM